MKALLLTFLASAVSVSAFSPVAKSVVGRGVALKQSRLFGINTENKGDFPEENEYTGSVDWDAEWKKVVQNEGRTVAEERPGKDYYKSESEIAAIKVANKATEQATGVASSIADSLPSLPDFNSLKNDWRFWIGILAVVSIVISVGAAPPAMPPPNLVQNADSYYI